MVVPGGWRKYYCRLVQEVAGSKDCQRSRKQATWPHSAPSWLAPGANHTHCPQTATLLASPYQQCHLLQALLYCSPGELEPLGVGEGQGNSGNGTSRIMPPLQKCFFLLGGGQFRPFGSDSFCGPPCTWSPGSQKCLQHTSSFHTGYRIHRCSKRQEVCSLIGPDWSAPIDYNNFQSCRDKGCCD